MTAIHALERKIESTSAGELNKMSRGGDGGKEEGDQTEDKRRLKIVK